MLGQTAVECLYKEKCVCVYVLFWKLIIMLHNCGVYIAVTCSDKVSTDGHHNFSQLQRSVCVCV